MSLIEDEETMDVSNMQEAKPAPKKEQIKGSDENKPGSASGAGGKITISASTETGLKNKVKEHNDKMKEGNKPDHTRATLGQLKAVYRRGAGAYSSSHRPGQTRGGWAMARVNAYLYLLRNGRPENPKYITDYDLLPTKHPKSTRKTNAVLITKETEVNLVDNLQETIDFAVEDTVNEDDVIETKASSAETYKTVADEKEDMMDEKEDMKDEDDKEDMKYPKEDMKDPKEDMEDPEEDEKEKSPTVAATELEDDDDAEKATQNSDASFTESEKQELERFRREEKEKVLNSYKEFLSETVYEEFNTTLDGFSRDTLEKELKVKVADYFMAQAKEIKQAKELESNQGFKTLQVINQLKDKDLANDISKLVDKYKK